ncbi:laminin G domain-containing protein [Streptacidiphilus sp. PAMC 29251]
MTATPPEPSGRARDPLLPEGELCEGVTDLPEGVPDLADVSGEWVDAEDLAHLPSLRNQWGQGHVNHDLSSMSWLAAPPYTFGYHTGVLRLDGAVLPAQRFRWKPWGVQREYVDGGLTVCTDSRMALSDQQLLWQIELVNDGDTTVRHTVSQDLFAMVAHTETGWGWLYDVPWTAGNHHDFMSLERIRATTRATTCGDGPAQGRYLLGPGERRLRLGRPRLPGIQRDADTEAMSLAFELPRHVSQDTVYPHRHSALATLRGLRRSGASGGDESGASVVEQCSEGEIALTDITSEVALGALELTAGQIFELEFRSDAPDQTGILLTHGNHPDSLQLGLDAGRLWFGICGEQEFAAPPIEPGRWYRVAVTLDETRVSLSLDGEQVAATSHWSASPRWKALAADSLVSVADSCSPARAAYGFDTAPDTVEDLGSGARAHWTITLEPGQTRKIGIVCAYGDDTAAVAAAASDTAQNVPGALAAGERGYRELWRGMFTPGNPHFSGHLPALVAEDPGVAKSYYMGALLALYMRNTRISDTEPIFLTGGPRLGPTTTYYWDHTEWSRSYALLEPAGLRSWLHRALSGPYDESFGFDTRNGGPLGNEYTASHYALFRLVEHYVCVTGDRAFLDQQAGSRTVFEHLDHLAHGWRDKTTAATGGVLADFGKDPWLLLECVPNYVNVVASFNAAYVGMMRSFAGLLRSVGRDEEADTALAQADAMAAALLELALPDGRWQIRHPQGDESIGHVLDFGLVAAHLHEDLSEEQRAAMVDFVSQKLLTTTWMRALAADDPAAPLADRPDHGAAGAFGAWPGVTAHGFAKLGRKDLAAQLLGRVHAAASGGLWGQAMEVVQDEARGQWTRVAEDGVSNRDSVAGVATTEAVISGLFGFEPSFCGSVGASPVLTTVHVPGVGTLSNLGAASPADSTDSTSVGTN